MIDRPTKQEIDKVVMKTLKEAGMKEPPFLIDDLFFLAAGCRLFQG